MTDFIDRRHSHWTPAEWIGGPLPPEFIAAIRDQAGGEVSHEKRLAAHGYERLIGEHDFQAFGLYIEIWRHESDHLIVEMWDPNTRLAFFVVSAEYATPFMATRFLEMQREIVTGDPYHHGIHQRALISFIRHGHGKDTIDPNGWETKDERIESAQRRREREWAEERLRQATQAADTQKTA